MRENVAAWSRNELEDRYFRLQEENLALKKKNNELETKVKQLGTRVIRTASRDRAIDGDDPIGGYQGRIAELEKQNNLLKDKLREARHHLSTYANTTLVNQYRSSGPSARTSSRPQSRPSVNTAITETHAPRHDESIGGMSDKLVEYEQQIQLLEHELQQARIDRASSMAQSQSLQAEEHHRSSLFDNMEIIKLERQLREKSSDVAKLQARVRILEEDLNTIRDKYDVLVTEFEHANSLYRSEQTNNAQLQVQIRALQSSQDTISLQIRQELELLKNENTVLKESNETLMTSAFDPRAQRDKDERELALRQQLSQLEASLNSDAAAKNDLLEKLADETHERELLEEKLLNAENNLIKLRSDLDISESRINKFTKDQNIDYHELQEAVTMLRLQKDRATREGLNYPDFLTMIKPKSTEEELTKLQIVYAETVEELEKTRNMLIVQHKINGDYEAEVKLVTQRMEENKKQYEDKLLELVEALDNRAARIQKLEKQIHDIAYGVKKINVTMPMAEDDGTLELDETLSIEPGHNLVELHISRILLMDEALQVMQTRSPSTFLTIEFYDFELQFTPVSVGTETESNYTVKYNVAVNDLFLHYLQTDSATMEIHQAIGTSYATIGAGQLYLSDLLTSPQAKRHGTVTLISQSGEYVGQTVAKVELWIGLRIPMEQALRLYKERAQAMGFLLADGQQGKPVDDSTNQLDVHLHRCHGVRSNVPGSLPSIYCMYQIYDFPDHDTKIVDSNENPEFSDHMIWTIPMNKDFDDYAKSQNIRIFLFDDTAPTDEESYLGFADVPLLPLAHNKPVRGTFQIRAGQDAYNGSIDISFSWQYVYISPVDGMHIPHPIVELPPEREQPTAPPAARPSESVMVRERKTTASTPLPPVVPASDSEAIRNVEERVVRDFAETRVVETQEATHSSSRVVETEGSETSAQEREGTAAASETADAAKPIPPPRKLLRGDSFTIHKGNILLRSLDPPDPTTTQKEGDQDDEHGAKHEHEERDYTKSPSDGSKSSEDTFDLDAKAQPGAGSTSALDDAPSGSLLGKLPPLAAPRRSLDAIQTSSELAETVNETNDTVTKRENEAGSSDDELDVISAAAASIASAGKAAEQQQQPKEHLKVEVYVNHVVVPDDSPIRLLPGVKDINVFVEFTFPDTRPGECETPDSLPIPASGSEKIVFKYQKFIPVTKKKELLLKEMIKNGSTFVFTLVSDPGDDGDCEDLGKAVVKAENNQITDKMDFIAKNQQGVPVATLNLSIHMPDLGL